MNISFENRLIWLAPERCATKITKKIFEKYNFFSLDIRNPEIFHNFQEKDHSHENFISEKYLDYKLITNIRNPYDLTFSIFINHHLSTPLTKNSSNVKEKFNDWVSKVFMNHGFHVFVCPFYQETGSFFKKWKFNDSRQPDFVVKTENIVEDIFKLPFIQKESEETKLEIKNILENNAFINKRYHVFNDQYEIRSAKLVYNFFKPIFHKFDYSPFSFAKNEINNDEKISFLHDPIV